MTISEPRTIDLNAALTSVIDLTAVGTTPEVIDLTAVGTSPTVNDLVASGATPVVIDLTAAGTSPSPVDLVAEGRPFGGNFTGGLITVTMDFKGDIIVKIR